MTPTADPSAPPRHFDTVLHRGPVVAIGKFRAHPSDPRFSDSGPTQGHLVVFPRTLVRIAHEGREGFVAGPDLVTYYNRGQVYRRESVGGRPDRCEWFAFSAEVLGAALAPHDPAAAERPFSPFRFDRGPGDPLSYFAQRRVVEGLEEGILDPREAEETMLAVLARLLRSACGRPRPGASGGRADRDLAAAARERLGRTFLTGETLHCLAAGLGVSVFRLCRVFRRETGTTLHACRRTLRMTLALELLGDRTRGLTDVALDLGYSSHSHFTAEFTREYRTTPSSLRARRRATSPARARRRVNE